MNGIKTRLLSKLALTKRVAMLDNVKTLRFSWAELEALITAATISGKWLFRGEGRKRPNVLTWLITLNGASMATDMAQRSVIIKIGQPQRSKTWEHEITAFIEANREAIIADCISLLRKPPRVGLRSYSRWASWEEGVLSRVSDPAAAQKLILARQAEADVEADEAVIITDYFREQLRSLRYPSDQVKVFIPSGVAADRFSQALIHAAALRIVRFGTANEFGDWITALHTFSYAHALDCVLRRSPSPAILRGVFHGALSVYLDRFLNVPPAPLPGERRSLDDEPREGAEVDPKRWAE